MSGIFLPNYNILKSVSCEFRRIISKYNQAELQLHGRLPTQGNSTQCASCYGVHRFIYNILRKRHACKMEMGSRMSEKDSIVEMCTWTWEFFALIFIKRLFRTWISAILSIIKSQNIKELMNMEILKISMILHPSTWSLWTLGKFRNRVLSLLSNR